MSTITVGKDYDYETIADAMAAAKDGDTIVVKGAAYTRTDERVSINKSVTLQAEGDVTVDSFGVGQGSAKSNDVTIKGFTFVTTSGNYNAEWAGGIYQNGTNLNSLTIEDCTFDMTNPPEKVNTCGIHFTLNFAGMQNFKCINSTFVGDYVPGSDTTSWTDCAILMSYQTGVEITGCTFTGIYGNAIQVSAQGPAWANYVECDYVITGNTITDCGYYGVYVTDIQNYKTNIEITDNYISNVNNESAAGAIILSSGKAYGANISGNVIEDCQIGINTLNFALHEEATGDIVIENNAIAYSQKIDNPNYVPAGIKGTNVPADAADNNIVVEGNEVTADANTEVIYVNANWSSCGDNTKVVADGKVLVIGVNAFASFVEAMDVAVKEGTTEIKVLGDVSEILSTDYEFIVNKDIVISADSAVTIALSNAGTSYDLILNSNNNNTITFGKNVTLTLNDRVIWAGYYGNNVDIIIEGTVSAYQWWNGADTTIQNGGKLIASGEALVLRRGATLTVNGDGSAETVELDANYFSMLSGNLVAKDATIVSGPIWTDNNGDYVNEGGVLIDIDNTTWSSSGNLKLTGEKVVFNIKNGSNVAVNDSNGYGASIISAKSQLNITGSQFTAKTLTSSGTVTIENATFEATTLSNSGTVNVSGESILNINSLDGSSIDLLDGAIVKNSTVGGAAFVAGNVTFRGDNVFTMITDYGPYYNYIYGSDAKWTVEEGASLTLTNKERYGLGYGDNVTINGSLTDADAARATLDAGEEVFKSFFTHGLVTMENRGFSYTTSFTVNNAYVEIGSNNSFGNSADRLRFDKPEKSSYYGGNYVLNFNNSVFDASRITFYEADSKTAMTFKDSNVKIGQFMTNDSDSTVVLDNSKVLSTATTNGVDEKNQNAGLLEVKNGSELTYNAEFTNIGTVVIDGAKFTAASVKNNSKLLIINGFNELTENSNLTVKVYDKDGVEIGSYNVTRGKGRTSLSCEIVKEGASYKLFNGDEEIAFESTKFVEASMAVKGESTLNIGSYNNGDFVWGKAIQLLDGAIIKDSNVGGYVDAVGKVTFCGDNTFGTIQDFEANYIDNNEAVNNTEMIIEKGASVTTTSKKFTIGFGDKLSVYGNLEDAKAAYEAGTLTADDYSLDAQKGMFFQGNRADDVTTFNVNDAYVRLGANGQNVANAKDENQRFGTYSFNWTNAVVEAEETFDFKDSGENNGNYNFNLDNTVLKVGAVETDKSYADAENNPAYRGAINFADKDSTFKAKDSNVVVIGKESNNYNAGTFEFDNSELNLNAALVNDGSATFDGENAELNATNVINRGTVTLANGAELNAGSYSTVSAKVAFYDGSDEPENITFAAYDKEGNEIGRTTAFINGAAEVAVVKGDSYKAFKADGNQINDATFEIVTDSSDADLVLDETAFVKVDTFYNGGTITVNVTDTNRNAVATVIDANKGANFGSIVVDEADAAAGVDYYIDEEKGDLVVYNKNLATTVYVNSEYSGNFGDKVADGKYFGINAFNSILDFNVGENTTTLEIAGGTYESIYNQTEGVSILKGNINTVNAAGDVVVSVGNLVFETENAGDVFINGSYTTLDKADWDNNLIDPNTGKPGYSAYYTGHIRFVGGDDTVFNINGTFNSAENIQFIGGKAIISADSVMNLATANSGQYAIYADVVNYGSMSVLDTQQSQCVIINEGGSLTLSGEKASLTTSIVKPESWKSDITVDNGSLIVENGAKVDASGIVNIVKVTGSVVVDNATFKAGNLINNNDITLKGNATFDVKDFDNKATLTLDGFTGDLADSLAGDKQGIVEAFGTNVITDNINTKNMYFGQKWVGDEDDDFEKGRETKVTIGNEENKVTVNVETFYNKGTAATTVANGSTLNVGYIKNYGKLDVDGVVNLTTDASKGTSGIGRAEAAVGYDNTKSVINVTGEFNVNTNEGATENNFVIYDNTSLNVAGGKFNADENTSIINDGNFNLVGNVTVNITNYEGNAVNVAKGVVLNKSSLKADLNIAGNITVTDSSLSGKFTGKKVTVTLDGTNNIVLADDSNVALFFDGKNEDVITEGSYFGKADISGKNNAVLTVDNDAFNGNKVSGVKLNLTGFNFVEASENYDVVSNVNVALDSILSINGVEVVKVVDSRIVEIDGVKYELSNTDKKITLNKITDDGSSSVNVKTFSAGKGQDVDYSDYTFNMLSGNRKLDVKNDAVLKLAAITKEGKGVTNIVLGKKTELYVGDVEAIGKLSTGAGATVEMGNVTATDANASIALGADNEASMGNVDLKGGKNSVTIGARSIVDMASLAGAASINLASGTAAKYKKGVLVADEDRTQLNITGALNADAKRTAMKAVNYADAKGTAIKAGNYADLNVGGNMNDIASINIGTSATLKTADINGTAKNNTLTFGKNASVDVENIDLKDGKNAIVLNANVDFDADSISNVYKITTGKGSKFTVDNNIVSENIANNYNFGANNEVDIKAIVMSATTKNSVKVGANSVFNVEENIAGAYRITTGKAALFNVNKISATELADVISFGAKTVNNIYAIDMAKGNDKLSLAANSRTFINTIAFGEGKDTLSFAKGAELSVDGVYGISGLDVVSGNSSNVIYLYNGARLVDAVAVKNLNKINVVSAQYIDDVIDIINQGNQIGSLTYNGGNTEFDLSDNNGRDTFKLDGNSIFKIQSLDDVKVSYLKNGVWYDLVDPMIAIENAEMVSVSLKEFDKKPKGKIEYTYSITSL